MDSITIDGILITGVPVENKYAYIRFVCAWRCEQPLWGK